MLRNYLTVAYRNLLKYKGYSLINIIGLAIGLACFTLILMFVLHERSYDKHHPFASTTYRLAVDIQSTDETQHLSQTPPIWSRLMQNDFPEVVQVVRFKPPRQTWMISNDDRNLNFAEKALAFADSNVFKLFDIPLIEGDPETALVGPDKMVVSEKAALKYFNSLDVVGKSLELDNQYNFTITAVMEDFPSSSHFHFDFLTSMESLRDPNEFYLLDIETGQFPFVYTYIQLADETSATSLMSKFDEFILTHVPEQFRPEGTSIRPYLQPITDIHLNSNLENEIEPNADASIIYIFLVIAIFILVIACVNFMNLTTARSAKRAKEVGMRKTMGAEQSAIATQFMGETMLISIIAWIVSYGFVYIALPAFNEVSGMSFGLADMFFGPLTLLLLAVVITVGMLSGSYPSLAIASTRPAEVLKASQKSGTGGHTGLRKALIIFQFGISIFLVIGTSVVYQQMKFANNQNFGLDREQVIVVQLTDPTPMNLFRSYKSQILQDPNVLSVSANFSAPAQLVNQGQMEVVNSGSSDVYQVQWYFGDYDFVETLGIDLLAGRTITAENPGDTLNTLIINETAVSTFGFESPEAAIGREIKFNGGNNILRVIGVVADFQSMSVRERIAPTVIGYARNGFFAFVRVNTDHIDEVISSLRATWNQVVPGYTFDYAFLDEDFAKLYNDERILNRLLTYFAGLAIFIACLGLLGLTSFTTQQRAKEIGIRKVMGSSVVAVVLLLTRDFTKLVAIAFLVSAPIGWYVMSEWLDTFVFHTTISYVSFAVAGVAGLLAAWLTVGYHTLKAASVNPVKSLRHE